MLVITYHEQQVCTTTKSLHLESLQCRTLCHAWYGVGILVRLLMRLTTSGAVITAVQDVDDAVAACAAAAASATAATSRRGK